MVGCHDAGQPNSGLPVKHGLLGEHPHLVFAIEPLGDVALKLDEVRRLFACEFETGCPYCDGYELEQGRLGVIATGAGSLHQALFLPEWGDVTLMTNGLIALEKSERSALDDRGVRIEETPVAGLEGHADVRLKDGRLQSYAGLFTTSLCRPASPIAEKLGCELEETPFGWQLKTNAQKHTSVTGAFACGDVAHVPHSVSLAVGDGAWAGAQVHRSLVF